MFRIQKGQPSKPLVVFLNPLLEIFSGFRAFGAVEAGSSNHPRQSLRYEDASGSPNKGCRFIYRGLLTGGKT